MRRMRIATVASFSDAIIHDLPDLVPGCKVDPDWLLP